MIIVGSNKDIAQVRHFDGQNYAEEMVSTGIVEAIRNEEGNLRYEYFFPMNDPETVLLIVIVKKTYRKSGAIRIHYILFNSNPDTCC